MGCASSTPAVADPVAGAFPFFFPAFTCVRCMRLKRDVRFARLLEGKQFYGKEGYFRGLLSYRNNADARRTDASFPELVILPLYVD